MKKKVNTMKYNNIINTSNTLLFIGLSIIEGVIEGVNSETFIIGLMLTLCLVACDIVHLLFAILKRLDLHEHRWMLFTQLLVSLFIAIGFGAFYWNTMVMWAAIALVIIIVLGIANLSGVLKK